jgi:hypothetical protein
MSMLPHEAFSQAGIDPQHIASALHQVAGSSLSFKAKPGLVEITKTVYRDGKLHKQRYHVRKNGKVEPASNADDAKSSKSSDKSDSKDKAPAEKAAPTPKPADTGKADEKKVEYLLKGWVKPTAHDDIHGGHVLRAAVAQKLGSDFGRDAKRSDLTDVKRKKIESEGAKYQKELAYIAAKSQAAHSGDFVTLHRGVEGHQAEAIKQALKEGKPVHIATDTVSSWTDDHATAQGFGKVVVSIRVPRSSIVASYKAFPKQFIKAEREVAIATAGGFGPNHITGVKVYK